MGLSGSQPFILQTSRAAGKKAAVGLGVVMPVSNLITVQRLLVASD